jgi:nucleotide-binding universal stress UspA family protein
MGSPKDVVVEEARESAADLIIVGSHGYLLDRRLDTLPGVSLAGLSLGLCVAFYALITAARRR